MTRVFGAAGWSGSGKTTLLERIVPVLVGQGLRVSLVKHAHHDFDVDQPGKDSYRHRQAGCAEVLVASRRRFALMHELRDAPEPTLPELLARLGPCDVVLVEGYKREPGLPKLEVYRAGVGKPLLHPEDPAIVAVASDAPLQTLLPRFDLEAIDAIAGFIRDRAIVLPVPPPDQCA